MTKLSNRVSRSRNCVLQFARGTDVCLSQNERFSDARVVLMNAKDIWNRRHLRRRRKLSYLVCGCEMLTPDSGSLAPFAFYWYVIRQVSKINETRTDSADDRRRAERSRRNFPASGNSVS